MKEWIKDCVDFAYSFMKDPWTISSIIPTSRFGIRRICSQMNTDIRRVIVEYGPGTGVLAKYLKKEITLTPDSKIILIEKTKKLADKLQKWIDQTGDKRFLVFHDSAENVEAILKQCGEAQADYVLLSIPLSKMPEQVRNDILTSTRKVLKPDGKLLVFLFRSVVRKYLEQIFSNVRSLGREWRNIPPLVLFEASEGPLPQTAGA